MHPVEKHTLDTLYNLLRHLDPDKTGWCIDGGAGIQDFFGVQFAAWGYPALIVEPKPSPQLLSALNGVHLEASALCATDGIVTLYEGHDGNTHSLDDNWQDVTGHPHKNTPLDVRGIRYQTLLDDWNIGTVSCLKLDVEGSEWSIIQQFPTVATLPRIVSIEYGGGYAKHTGMGGWQPHRFGNVLRCVDTLRACGYTHGAHCEDDGTHYFAFSENPQGVWRANAGYGNLVVWQS
jgi:FkbM family methyltransferase